MAKYFEIVFDPNSPWDTCDFQFSVGNYNYVVYYKGSKKSSWTRLSTSTKFLMLARGPGYPYWNNSSTVGSSISFYGVGNQDRNYSFPILRVNSPHGNYILRGNLDALVEGGETTITDPNIPPYAFQNMFGSKTSGCLTDITQLVFPSKTSEYCFQNMFKNTTQGVNVFKIPPDLPALNLSNNCYANMFDGCYNIKMSDTKKGAYRIPYRIPSSGTGIDNNGTSNMFASTGGIWTGTPQANKTYYLFDDSYVETPPLYIGVNGRAREVTDMYVGVNGRARKVTAIYVGVNGRAREVFKAT